MINRRITNKRYNKNKTILIRNSFITMMLALVAMTGLAQTTKTITITDSSPALKDGTLMPDITI